MENLLCICIIAIALIAGFGIVIYADIHQDQKFDDKVKVVDEKIREKLEKMNIGQLRVVMIEYSYCVHYEDYLISIDFPSTYVNKIGCLNNLEKLVDGI